ncbi:MAG: class SAM-dependent methyltransferase [Candidatus Nomurabacteria bacterium]|nr:class SAM-dependent methyltransferase [Candidatus Nomurabacteria bacterium]
MSDKWKEYFEKTKDAKPRSLLVKAQELVKQKNNALDLGSGALNDVRYLLSLDFKHIVAVDKTSIEKDILEHFLSPRLSYVISRFEDFTFVENNFDLINAQYSLPFIQKKDFDKVFKEIVNSLKIGGIFTGQLFGTKDGWNTDRLDMTFHTADEAKKLFSGIKLIEFREEENDKPTALGEPKHWHVFHFIAEK